MQGLGIIEKWSAYDLFVGVPVMMRLIGTPRTSLILQASKLNSGSPYPGKSSEVVCMRFVLQRSANVGFNVGAPVMMLRKVGIQQDSREEHLRRTSVDRRPSRHASCAAARTKGFLK
jgi:hypothetical protein